MRAGGASAIVGPKAPVTEFDEKDRPGEQVERTVEFLSDGLRSTPEAYARLLAKLAGEGHAGADQYMAGGCVAELEKRCAEYLGKERAVFVPTGTMANHLAIRCQAGDKTRVFLQCESHVYNDELDCVPALSHLNVVPLAAGRATFTLGDLEEAFQRAGSGPFPVRGGVISIESPVRRMNGEAFDFEEMKKIAAFAREHDIRMHLDGARLLLAPPYTGVATREYAAQFDTVYISLYKYLGAGTGAILAGPREVIDRVSHAKKMFGGGLYHAWPYAAVALHHLDGFEQRFKGGVTTARALFARLEPISRLRVELIPHGTNIVKLHVLVHDVAKFRADLQARGVLVRRPSPDFRGFLLVVNESLNRVPADRIAEAFLGALAASDAAPKTGT